jgi:hypothetical protein
MSFCISRKVGIGTGYILNPAGRLWKALLRTIFLRPRETDATDNEAGGLPLRLAPWFTTALLPALVLFASPPEEPKPAEPEASALVHLADGTSLPLRRWAFSYEYASWATGEDFSMARTARRETRELWVGKRVLTVAGQSLEIVREPGQRKEEGAAAPVTVPNARVREWVLRTADARQVHVRPEAPNADLLVPHAKGQSVAARALDLKGETLTGSARSFCLLSYSPLVVCPLEPARLVVKVEFP